METNTHAYTYMYCSHFQLALATHRVLQKPGRRPGAAGGPVAARAGGSGIHCGGHGGSGPGAWGPAAEALSSL